MNHDVLGQAVSFLPVQDVLLAAGANRAKLLGVVLAAVEKVVLGIATSGGILKAGAALGAGQAGVVEVLFLVVHVLNHHKVGVLDGKLALGAILKGQHFGNLFDVRLTLVRCWSIMVSQVKCDPSLKS